MQHFHSKKTQLQTCYIFCYCLLIAAGCLLFCSKSSFLYPINDWSDANIFFSMGKGMANGKVLYRDIYDHKGPLLYALHALCYLISPLSFTGVWLMEVFCLAIFLKSVHRLLCLYEAGHVCLWMLPVMSLLTCIAISFQQGDSAEELCLPMLSCSFVSLLTHIKTTVHQPMRTCTLLLNGFLCGCVLWIKFTMLGLYAAWILTVLILAIHNKNGRTAWKSLGLFLAGIVFATLPWVLYFFFNDALHPWLKTYLYDNLFLYSLNDESVGFLGHAKAIVQSVLSWIWQNLPYTSLIALGLVWVTFRKSSVPLEKASIWLCASVSTLGVFIGGKSYLYYGHLLVFLAPLGLIPLCRRMTLFLNNRYNGKRIHMAICSGFFVAVCVLSYVLSPNVQTSFLKSRKQTMQYQFAEIIAQDSNASLLNYGFMDAGFYTATGIVPSVKYFHQTNVPLQEMLNEQQRYIEDGTCLYVVTRGKQPESIHNRYELIATADSPGFWYTHVYLYRLRET